MMNKCSVMTSRDAGGWRSPLDALTNDVLTYDVFTFRKMYVFSI